MKILLYLEDKILTFKLPSQISGSFSFDEDAKSERKLINIDADNGKWKLYSTTESSIMQGMGVCGSVELVPNSFYFLRRDGKTYLIYVCNIIEKISCYEYNTNINLMIGNTDNANIKYNIPYSSKVMINIICKDNKLLLSQNIETGVKTFINNSLITSNEYNLKIGEEINFYGLRITFFNKFFIINDQNKNLSMNYQTSNISKYIFTADQRPRDIIIKDIDLYSKNSYYSKSPRLRRLIETKKIKITPPPNLKEGDDLPILLTVGPMFTMGISSSMMLLDVLIKINNGETTFKESWTSILTAAAMLISMLVWPLITQMYSRKLKEKKNQKLMERYNKYLDDKRKEFEKESKLQSSILYENLISLKECIDAIQNKSINFWDKRTEQNDFLVARIGVGNEKLNIELDYSEEDFISEESDLINKVNKIIDDFKYIPNVPIGYSFYENKLTAIMGSVYKINNFTNNILLQLITFYNYEDLKIVIFTNKSKEKNWEYLKYLNHNFNNEKNFRFFASDLDSIKEVADYLNIEATKRAQNIDQENNKEEENKHNEFKPYYLIITDDYESIKNQNLIKTITETDSNIGYSVIILENSLSKLPSKCNNFISIGEQTSGVLKNAYEKQEQIIFQDEINYNINMKDITKIVSNIPIILESGVGELPDAITFLEMEQVGKVEQLNILNRWNTNDATSSLKAEIGVDNRKNLLYLDLHEKYHGPHGLIAGTTGSGKSEFIITYILSMCINYSPDDVAFILIDYKGGGLALAFENKTTGVSLPHLAGTITNLDKAEMNRTLVSIDSEVKRRQKKFNEARDKLGESTIDIYKYQKHYKEGRLEEPIPHLFIICDEFAELKAQQPEFMDNLISVARIGRSLGVHLILATQKPSGVVNDQIWSNTKFRVCLKVQDEADSKEMLKRPEAAHIKQAGRFYLQVGYDEIFELGQSGWCGAKYYPSDRIIKEVDKSINIINDYGHHIKDEKEVSEIKVEAQGEQLAAVMKNIISISNEVNKKAKRLWLENIPNIITTEYIEKKYNFTKTPYNIEAIIGEYDAPELQEQGIVKYNYLEQGNTLVYGMNSSENEMFLSQIIYSTSKYHTSEEVNFYCIDFGSESLRKYQNLPQIGGLVFNGETEKYNNLIKLIKTTITKRKKLFINYSGEYSNYIKNSGKTLPLKIVIINNFDSFYETYPDTYDTLPDIIRDSERYGIIFILTGSATNSITSRISQNFSNIYAFKLKDPTDYKYLLNSKSNTTPRDIEGRGVLNNGELHEFQVANITEKEEEENKYLTEFINKQQQINKTAAERIPVLPDIVRVNDIKSKITTLNQVPVGIEKNSLNICTLDLKENLGTIISSKKIINTKLFIQSLTMILSSIPNTTLMIIDPKGELQLDKKFYPNYFKDNIEKSIDIINNYIENLISTNKTQEGTLLVYGYDEFVNQTKDNEGFEKLYKNIKKYKKLYVIAVEEQNKLKEYSYEDYHKDIFGNGNGIWIGTGVTEQNVLKTSEYNKELQLKYKNDMGFKIQDEEVTIIKLIDFITQDKGSNNNGE